MIADIIDCPISGTYPEKHFGNTSTHCIWILFTDDNYQQWVGSFEKGLLTLSRTILLKTKEISIVLANGKMYLINVNTRECIYTSEASYVKNIVVDTNEENIFFTTGYELYQMDCNGNTMELLEDRYYDDLSIMELKGNTLYVSYHNYQSSKKTFTLEIDWITNEIKDSYDSFVSSRAKEKKKSVFWRLVQWLSK